MAYICNSKASFLSVSALTTFLIASNATCFAYEMVVIGYVAYQDMLAKKAANMLKLEIDTNNNNNNTKVLPISSTTKVALSKSDADNAKIQHKAENQEFEDWGEDGVDAFFTRADNK